MYGDYFGIKLVAYVVSAFLVTNASHFFLDLFPVWKGSGDRVKGTMKGGVMAPARWFFEGLSGDQIYEKLEGTYRIHLPFAIPEKKELKRKGKTVHPEEMMKTLPALQTRAWLVLSGLVNLVFAVLLLNLSIHFLPI